MAENRSARVANELAYFYSLVIPICILGVVSNVLLLVAFIKDPLKCFRNSGTYLVMNLSVSDCLAVVFCSLLHVASMTRFPSIWYFFASWFASVSYVSIISISIDRFLIVAYPLKYRTLINGKVITLWMAAIWSVSCIIPTFLLFSDFHEKTIFQAHFTFSAIVVILSSVMYSSTYYKYKKQSKNIALQNLTESRAQIIRSIKEKRFLKTIIIIASIAFVCVVPSMIVTFVYHSGYVKDSFIATATFLSSIPFYTNFAVNPLIYILRLPNYRETFDVIYCRKRRASNSDSA